MFVPSSELGPPTPSPTSMSPPRTKGGEGWGVPFRMTGEKSKYYAVVNIVRTGKQNIQHMYISEVIESATIESANSAG